LRLIDFEKMTVGSDVGGFFVFVVAKPVGLQ
jgi:hypothetical protein